MQVNLEAYLATKSITERGEVLKAAVLSLPEDGKAFFAAAFKKERYLDMKLTAVRGYAAYATEEEVTVLMTKLQKLLTGRLKTRNNYTEYEPMRSAFLMPFLLKRYGYECFRAFDAQLQQQYDAMDDEWKGLFTLDEQGRPVTLRQPVNQHPII